MNRIGIITVVLSILGSTACSRVSRGAEKPIPDSEMIAVLTQLSQANKRIWDHLQTWQGTFAIESTSHYYGRQAVNYLDEHAPELTERPKAFVKKSSIVETFALDLNTDRLYTEYSREKADLLDAETGQPFGVEVGPYHQVSVVMPDHIFHYQPDVLFGGVRGIDQPARRTGFKNARTIPSGIEEGAFVDPRDLLKYGRPLWETLDMTVKGIREYNFIERLAAEGQRIVVTVSGEKQHKQFRVVLAAIGRPGYYKYQDMIFPASAGYNVTSLIIRDSNGMVHQKLKWAYRRDGDDFLPIRREFVRMDVKSQRERSISSRTLVDSVINQPIPESKFTYQALGMKDGDRFVDKNTRTIYRHKDGKLKSIAKGLDDKQLDTIFSIIANN